MTLNSLITIQPVPPARIHICGIGPGNPGLIVPEVFQLVEASDWVAGGRRHLAVFDVSGKETLEIQNNIPEIIQKIKQSPNKKLTVLVSGDTGFHSLLRSFLDHFSAEELHVVPGISTYQYFFAKMGMTYEDAWIGSLHGRLVDFLKKVKTHQNVFLLTDVQNSWKHIAIRLSDHQLGECKMHVGNRLSYPDETIVTDTADRLKTQNYHFDLCAVIVINNKIAKL
jgi:cobalt-precorrin-7 (C5)-methyltransferase